MANKPFAIQGADLTLGGVKITLNDNGSVTFPDGSVQTTAYKGGNLNTWVQTFETSLRIADIPSVATSVEYLANGDIVALFVNLKDINLGFASYNTYTGVARFDTIGRLVWSMNFQGNNEFEDFTDGWGLAVDNIDGYIYVAGRVGALFGGNTATLTKLSQATGGIEWSKTYDVGYNNSNTVVDVASDGSPIVVGFASGSGGTANRIVTSKINASNGLVTWSRALDGQGDEEAYGMAVGPNNEVVAVGFMDNIDYPGPTYTILTLTANPVSDPGWVNNLTGVTNGGLTFDVSFTAGVPTFTNIVDTTGNHYASEAIGMINAASLGPGSTDLQFIVGTTTTEDLSNRMLVVKYTSTGTMAWQKSVAVEADYDCSGADADIDSMGNIYVCGNFEQDGDSAMIIFKFNSLGVKQWSRKVEGNCGNFATSIVVGPDDYLYLSAVTDAGTFPDHDYNMVIAKYNLDGTVVWQRLLENTTTQTFGGAWWFINSGGSNLAVRDGYVAVAGSFGEPLGPGDVTNALVAQFDTAGTEFEIGDYALVAATFSGTLDSSASNITVADAAKADSNYYGQFDIYDFTPAVDLTSDLIGILYYGDSGSDDRLTNGANNLVLTPAGAVTLPKGGTISEGYVTSNPTIQLMPARPDVASQKLVIKGGGAPTDYTRNNNLQLYWYSTTTNIGDTISFEVTSGTYADQTLYWWIYPENAGLGDPNYGTVALNEFGDGSFNFDVASVAYEFTVRVSPINGQYDPDNVGVESWLINGDSPTYPDHHLHLTTGDLAVTSIFLGTDDHNVRTTTNGGMQITTSILGIPTGSVTKTTGNQGWGNDQLGNNLPTTGGTGIGLTVDVIDTGSAYSGISINTPGSGYLVGDVITVTSLDNSISDSFTINNVTTGAPTAWTFGTDGDLTVPGIITRPVDDTLILVTSGANGNSSSISIDGEFGRTLLRTNNGTALKTWEFSNTGTLTVPGSIIPATNISYDLGSPTAKFRSLYLSTSTIFIGTSTISISETGQMLVNGNDAISKLEYFGGEGIGPRDAGSIGWNTSTFTFNLPGKELLTAIYDLKPGNKIRGVNTQQPQFGGFDREFTIVGNARQYIRSGGYQMAAIDIAETTSTNRYVYALYLPVKDKTATLANGTWTLTLSALGGIVFPDSTVQTTAYQKVAAPARSYGATGDKVDMVAFDGDYIYYCKQDYVSTSTNIWVRVAWTGTTW